MFKHATKQKLRLKTPFIFRSSQRSVHKGGAVHGILRHHRCTLDIGWWIYSRVVRTPVHHLHRTVQHRQWVVWLNHHLLIGAAACFVQVVWHCWHWLNKINVFFPNFTLNLSIFLKYTSRLRQINAPTWTIRYRKTCLGESIEVIRRIAISSTFPDSDLPQSTKYMPFLFFLICFPSGVLFHLFFLSCRYLDTLKTNFRMIACLSPHWYTLGLSHLLFFTHNNVRKVLMFAYKSRVRRGGINHYSQSLPMWTQKQ